MMTTLVIRNGTVIDGSGREGFYGDVAISGDTIIACGDVPSAADCREIDASGLVVAPGFIDIHSHSDYTLLVDPRALSSLYQGVTLEVIGNCGHGCFPIRDRELAVRAIYGYRSEVPITWRSAEEYFDRLEEAAPAINVMSLVPNGQLRLATVGMSEGPASKRELSRMVGLLEAALREGAWGLSTGLEYPAEAGATADEVGRLCEVVAAVDGLYATHTRNRDAGAADAVTEAIVTAERAGVRLQISHLLPRSGPEEGRKCVSLVEDAHARGLDVAFDMHTRTFGLTHLFVALPTCVLRGSSNEIVRSLSDPVIRERIKSSESMLSRADAWERTFLLDNEVWPEYAWRDIAAIAAERGQEPFDAVCDLLLRAADDPHSLMVSIQCYEEEQQRDVFSHPLCMPASDATALSPDGRLAGSSFYGAYTWASWFYRFMVRDQGLLSPEEAVYRLTGLPASRLGIRDRGVIRAGARADIVVFDPATYGERGTLFDPHRPAVGVAYVLVNGVLALADGAPTGQRPGQVLRRAL